MSEWLQVEVGVESLGVDRETNTIRGVIIAEEGRFRTADRGEFDAAGIRKIVALGNAKQGGLMSRLSHPTSDKDHIFSLLGRVKRFTEDVVMRDGSPRLAARGDLVFGGYAFKTPHGDLASHVMNIIEEDPEGLGMSLSIKPEKVFRRDNRSRSAKDENGNQLPPLWNPLEIDAVDVVGRGEATRSMLAVSEPIEYDAEVLRLRMAIRDR